MADIPILTSQELPPKEKWRINKELFPRIINEKSKEIDDLLSVTKLKESGLNFKAIPSKKKKKSKGSSQMSEEEKEKPLLEIKLVKKQKAWWLPCLKETIVEIPRTHIDDGFEIFIRNMIALELFHYPESTYVCHYADMMNYLIDTAHDVDLLATEGIIVNCMGDHEKVAQMFNGITTCISLSPRNCYYEIAEEMKQHYENRWNHLKAKLKSVYFPNLLKGTATLAAIALIILTFIGTVCSILQVLPQS